MLMAGMTPAFAARQLGHSVKMFLDTYARWLDRGADEVELARPEAILPRNLPGCFSEVAFS
jgi:integrase